MTNILWKTFREEWLISRGAAKLFFIATVLVILVTPQLFGFVNPLQLAPWLRLLWSMLSMAGVLAMFFLWFGMWRYWARLDDSAKVVKRVSFVILLLGFWWGSCIYCYFIYLPQVFRRNQNGE